MSDDILSLSTDVSDGVHSECMGACVCRSSTSCAEALRCRTGKILFQFQWDRLLRNVNFIPYQYTSSTSANPLPPLPVRHRIQAMRSGCRPPLVLVFCALSMVPSSPLRRCGSGVIAQPGAERYFCWRALKKRRHLVRG